MLCLLTLLHTRFENEDSSCFVCYIILAHTLYERGRFMSKADSGTFYIQRNDKYFVGRIYTRRRRRHADALNV